MATLQPVRYGKVVGRLVNIIADGPDEDEFPISGGYPDAVPMTGRVTFTARASRVLVVGAEPSPVTVFSAPVTAQLDENGYLTHNGKRGVFLLAPSVETNPPEWTYTVKYDLQDYEGNAVTHIFDMEIVEYEPGPNPADPDAGSTAVDLTVVTPVNPAPGQPTVVGPQGDTIIDITLSGDGSALVFHVQRVSGVDLESVDIPALGDLVGAVAVAESARDEAVTAADDATSFAGVAGAAATLAVEKAEEAAGYVGGVADGAISTPKVQDGAVTLAKTSAGVQASLGKADTAVQPAALTSKADLSAGKLLASQLPDLAVVEFKGSVATQAAMLALTAERGDWVFRSDLGTNWIVIAEPASALANWRALNYPASPVASVAGKTGVVTLVPGDIAGTAVVTTDGRLSDTRTPTDGTVTNAKVPAGANIDPTKLGTGRVVGSNNGTPTSLTLWVGTAAQYAAIGTKDANTFYGVV